MFNLKACAAAALVLALVGGAQAAAFSDGSFSEAAQLGSNYGYVNYGGGPSSIGVWSVAGGVDLIKNYWTGPNGSYSVDLNGTTAGSISQTFNLAAGEYQLSFWLAGNPDGSPALKSVAVSVGDQSGVNYTFLNNGQQHTSMGWTLETLDFHAAGSTTLTFQSTTVGADPTYSPFGAAVGDVSIAAVPEPASLGMFLAAVGMFGVMASRRRAR